MLFKNKSYLYFTVFILLSVWGVALRASEACRQALGSKQTVREHFVIEPSRIYVEGSVRANNLLFLSYQDYIEFTSKDQIPIDSIIVLEDLPLEVDLPLVSAIIIGKDLSLDGTHIQMLAEKLGIPLIVSSSFATSFESRRFADAFAGFELTCGGTHCEIAGSSAPFVQSPKLESVLPLYADRYVRDLFNVHNLLELTSREVVGDKYYSLMEFKKRFPNLVPDISVLTSGFYERFLDNYVANGELLRVTQSHLERRLVEGNESHDESAIKSALQDMRDAIIVATPYRSDKDVFVEAVQKIKDYYGKKTRNKFSIRSNNDVEDLLATGLYKSTSVDEIESEAIGTALRKVWASLYDYRAYSIRRYWGQNESNLSMPIMLHPFLENIYSHSVGSFHWNEKSGLELTVNMVLGQTEKATNPSSQAEQIKFIVRNKNINKNQVEVANVVVGSGSGNNNSNNNQVSTLPKYISKPIVSFFSEVQKYVAKEFQHRNFRPKEINIEFVVEKPKYFWNSPKVQILQYKPALDRELVYSLLTGRLTRAETDRRDLKYINSKSLKDVLRQNQLKSFGELIPEKLWAYYHNSPPRHKRHLRYVLVLDGNTPRFLVWDSGVFHGDMKMNLQGSPLQWMKSGYITFKDSKDNPTLIFSETTVNDETDRALLLSISSELFNLAFQKAENDFPELKAIITDLNPTIVFHTFEGSGQIQHGN